MKLRNIPAINTCTSEIFDSLIKSFFLFIKNGKSEK